MSEAAHGSTWRYELVINIVACPLIVQVSWYNLISKLSIMIGGIWIERLILQSDHSLALLFKISTVHDDKRKSKGHSCERSGLCRLSTEEASVPRKIDWSQLTPIAHSWHERGLLSSWWRHAELCNLSYLVELLPFSLFRTALYLIFEWSGMSNRTEFIQLYSTGRVFDCTTGRNQLLKIIVSQHDRFSNFHSPLLL